MKVLIYRIESELAPVGGPLGYCYNIHEELKKRGITNIEFLPDLPKSNLKSNSIKKYASSFFKLLFGKKNNFDFSKYDAVHFHSVKDLYLNRRALKKYKGKVFFTMHSPVPFHIESNENIKKHHKFLGLFLSKHAFSKMDKYAFNRADYIVLPCVEAEESYYSYWKYYKKLHEKNKDKYRYIPTGIVGATPKVSAEEYRQSLGYSKDDFIISYVGRHNEVKGYDRIIKIAELLNNPYIKFLIGGKEFPLQGPKLENWKEIGWTNDPYSLVNCSNLFILPNRETYFDIVMLETLSLGKNSLISNTGGNKVIINQNVKGVYSFDSEEEAAGVIKELYEKHISYEPNKDIKELFKNNYSIEIFVSKYLTMLDEVINNKDLTKMENKKIKVLHVVVDMGHGGYENLLMNVYRNIDREKFEFDFLSFKSHEAYFEKEILFLGGKVFHLPMENKLNFFKSKRLLKNIVSNNSFDIIHCHNTYYSVLYLPILKKVSKNIIIHSHIANKESTLKGRMVHLLTKYPSKKKYHNLACSKKAGIHMFGNKNGYEICPNCIESSRFVFDRDTSSSLKKKYNIKESSYVLGHIGRFTPQKNHEFLLEITKELIKKGKDVVLCLCGVGALKEKVIEQVENDNYLRDRVVFLEPGDTSKYYSLFDAFVLPSQFEGFPLVLLESQAAGCYSLVSSYVTDEARLTDVIEYLPIDSIEPWINKIEELIDSPKYDRVKLNKVISESQYDVKSTCKFLANYYESLVNKNDNK